VARSIKSGCAIYGIRSTPATAEVQGAASSTLGAATVNGPAEQMNVSTPGQTATRTFSISSAEHITGVVNAVHVNPTNNVCVTLSLLDAAGNVLAISSAYNQSPVTVSDQLKPGSYAIRFEICDLVDLDDARLSVSRSLVSVGYALHESRGKTRTARRCIDLDERTVDMLRTTRASRGDDAYVFARDDGSPYHPQLLSDAFKRLVRRSGLPRIRLHDLRHTHATLLLKAGVRSRSSPNGSVTQRRASRWRPISTCSWACKPKPQRRSPSCSHLSRIPPGRGPGRTHTSRDEAQVCRLPDLGFLVAGAGFEPATFGC
jgi:hypothetical protein